VQNMIEVVVKCGGKISPGIIGMSLSGREMSVNDRAQTQVNPATTRDGGRTRTRELSILLLDPWALVCTRRVHLRRSSGSI
jgi:hypothetical protein